MTGHTIILCELQAPSTLNTHTSVHCLDAFFRAHSSLDLEHATNLDLPSVLHPIQIEGVTPPSAESLPSQILEPETLLSEEGEDHREVRMYVVVPCVIT